MRIVGAVCAVAMLTSVAAQAQQKDLQPNKDAASMAPYQVAQGGKADDDDDDDGPPGRGKGLRGGGGGGKGGKMAELKQACRKEVMSKGGGDGNRKAMKGQVMICVAQVRLDCTKQAVASNATGKQLREAVKDCMEKPDAIMKAGSDKGPPPPAPPPPPPSAPPK